MRATVSAVLQITLKQCEHSVYSAMLPPFLKQCSGSFLLGLKQERNCQKCKSGWSSPACRQLVSRIQPSSSSLAPSKTSACLEAGPEVMALQVSPGLAPALNLLLCTTSFSPSRSISCWLILHAKNRANSLVSTSFSVRILLNNSELSF